MQYSKHIFNYPGLLFEFSEWKMNCIIFCKMKQAIEVIVYNLLIKNIN